MATDMRRPIDNEDLGLLPSGHSCVFHFGCASEDRTLFSLSDRQRPGRNPHPEVNTQVKSKVPTRIAVGNVDVAHVNTVQPSGTQYFRDFNFAAILKLCDEVSRVSLDLMDKHDIRAL
jgi:hypothetical protein